MEIKYGEPKECSHCKGKKEVYYDGTHSMYEDSGWITCPFCLGSGLMIERVVTTRELVAYDPRDHEPIAF